MKKTFGSILIASLIAGSVAAPAFAAANHRDMYRPAPHKVVVHRAPPHKMVVTNRHHWKKGQRMGRVERSRYVVNDWGRHGLRAPPRGYHWVRENNNTGDYILVAIATGLIASVIAR